MINKNITSILNEFVQRLVKNKLLYRALTLEQYRRCFAKIPANSGMYYEIDWGFSFRI